MGIGLALKNLGKNFADAGEDKLRKQQLAINERMVKVQEDTLKFNKVKNEVQRKLDEQRILTSKSSELGNILAAIGGIEIKDEERRTELIKQFPIIKNLFGKQWKNGVATGKWEVHDPDAMKKQNAALKAQLAQQQKQFDNWIKLSNKKNSDARVEVAKDTYKLAEEESGRKKERHEVFIREPSRIVDTQEGLRPMKRGGTELGDVIAQKRITTPAGVKEKMIDIRVAKRDVVKIRKLFDPAFTGKLKGGVVGSAMSTLKMLNIGEEEFRTVVSGVKNKYAVMMSGGAIPIEEWPIWLEKIPNLSDHGDKFLAKLKVLEEETDSLYSDYQQNFSKSGKQKIGSNVLLDKFRDDTGNIDISKMNKKQLAGYKAYVNLMIELEENL